MASHGLLNSGSNEGMAPARQQTTALTNVDLVFIGPLGRDMD